MPSLVKIYNAPMVTIAAPPKIATGAVIRTMLQVLRTVKYRVVEWAISFDGLAAATPGVVELLTTGTIAATMATAHAITGVQKYSPADQADATGFTLSTTGTAFGIPSAEGTIVASRMYEAHEIAPTNQLIMQLPLAREPDIKASDVLRIRCTFPATVNCLVSVLLELQ